MVDSFVPNVFFGCCVWVHSCSFWFLCVLFFVSLWVVAEVVWRHEMCLCCGNEAAASGFLARGTRLQERWMGNFPWPFLLSSIQKNFWTPNLQMPKKLTRFSFSERPIHRSTISVLRVLFVQDKSHSTGSPKVAKSVVKMGFAALFESKIPLFRPHHAAACSNYVCCCFEAL